MKHSQLSLLAQVPLFWKAIVCVFLCVPVCAYVCAFGPVHVCVHVCVSLCVYACMCGVHACVCVMCV